MGIIDAISLHKRQTSISLFDSRIYLFGIQKIDMSVKESDIRLARRIYEKYVYPTIRTEFKVIVDGNLEKDNDK